MNGIIICGIIVVGVVILLWLVVGVKWRNGSSHRHKFWWMRSSFEEEGMASVRELLYSGALLENVEKKFRPLVRVLQNDGQSSVCFSDIEIITNGRRKLDLLVEDIKGARESIHMEYFHFGIDSGSRLIRRLLMQKVKEGVRVRFINENVANFPIPDLYFDLMRRAGVEVRHFTKVGFSLLRLLSSLNYRDHRKVVVIDGRIGYTGGMNINNHYFYQWRDTHLRLTGDAVASLQYAFLDTWFSCGGEVKEKMTALFPMALSDVRVRGSILTQIVPDGPIFGESVLLKAYLWIIENAQRYVWMQSPYLAPPIELMDVIRRAVERGVVIRIMIPQRCDTLVMRPINRSYYRDFLDAGVELYIRSGEFIHSKTIVCDDYLSCVGSTNLDCRSFGLGFEINTFLYDRGIALEQKRIIEADLPICHLLTRGDLERTSAVGEIWQKFWRLLSPVV